MILVIGYGNRLCGDDALGQYVADRISEITDPTEVRVLAIYQLTPELVEPISRANLVIFIDAKVGDPAGQINVTPIVRKPDPAPFTHNMSPAALLSGAYTLYGACPDAVLYSVTAQDFRYTHETNHFSPPVQEALPELTQLIQILIEERIAQCTNMESFSHL
jgi:hydrogenase maturation protease